MTDETMAAGDETASDKRAPAYVARQAYVLIHGMGEQRPMDTVKGCAKTIWAQDTGVRVSEMPNAEQMWSRPDSRAGSLELRRMTTRKSRPGEYFPAGVRTDFYELYGRISQQARPGRSCQPGLVTAEGATLQ